MPIYLPPTELNRFKKLAEMKPEDLDRLIVAFRAVGVQRTLADFISQASRQSSYAPETVASVVETLHRLNRRRLAASLEIREFVDDLEIQDKIKSVEDVTNLKRQLKELLDTGISSLAKA